MFTVLFLRSLPANSDLGNKCVLKILDYLRVIKNDKESSINVSGQFRDMPVYTHLQTQISEVYMTTQKLENRDSGSNKEEKHGGKFDNRNKQFSSKSYSQPHYYNRNSRGVDQSNGTELAASLEMDLMKLWSSRFPYMASKQIFLQCKISGENKNHHSLCYNGLCSKCHFVEHKTDNCRQKLTGGTLARAQSGIDEAMLLLDGIRSGKFKMIEKLNSGASRCMSGNPHRLVSSDSISNVTILGFNRSMSKPDRIGLNKDGKQEYFVSSMPSNLTLLCAHAYAEDG
eukprot:gene14860-31547_t